MREILFRGKNVDNGKWVYGSYVEQYGAKEIYLQDGVDEHGFDRHHVIPETVGQYAGLTDKNGKKIFEGDIFKFLDEVWESSYTSCGTEYASWEIGNYGVVGFDEDTARFGFIQYKYNENSVAADFCNNDVEFADFVKELEIIGNIHDNPELLKGE